MRKLLGAGIVFLGIFACAASAAAQDYKPVDINIGFGWAFPTQDFKQSFDAGWNGSFGATFNLNEKVGILGEYMYTHMNGPERTISCFTWRAIFRNVRRCRAPQRLPCHTLST